MDYRQAEIVGADMPGIGWSSYIKPGDEWIWQSHKLWHRSAKVAQHSGSIGQNSYRKFVSWIYADQNRTRSVRDCLGRLIGNLTENSLALNIGAGTTRYPHVVNFDIVDGVNIDIVGVGAELPFQDDSVDLVILQEVLEHVPDFNGMLAEILRVLRVGGVLYLQVPFQIGFHPGPKDFWRFSRQGIEELFCANFWEIEDLRISCGHGSALYRIAVEFFSVTTSVLWQPLYRPTKLACALLLYPVKWFDIITEFSAERDRIPGGYLCVVRKVC